MRDRIVFLIAHIICAITCGATFIWTLVTQPEAIAPIILVGVIAAGWLCCIITDIADIIIRMEPVFLRCPKCNKKIVYTNWFIWVLHSPMHWFGKRYTKCHCCKARSWMRREK